MAKKRYLEAALAIVSIEMQLITPALRRERDTSREPKRPQSAEACTTREFAAERIFAEDGYRGRHPEDIYITAPALAEVLGVSNETARRRLQYFEEQGVLRLNTTGGSRRKYYELNRELTGVDDENVRSESTIIDTAKKLLAAAEED